MAQRLDVTDSNFDADFAALVSLRRDVPGDVNAVVAAILADVRDRGDAAVIHYTEKFDNLNLTPDRIRISQDEIDALTNGNRSEAGKEDVTDVVSTNGSESVAEFGSEGSNRDVVDFTVSQDEIDDLLAGKLSVETEVDRQDETDDSAQSISQDDIDALLG